MVPNKEWMNIEDHLGEYYEKGVESFLDYAFTRLGTETIRCPCVKCVNIGFETREEVQGHLLAYGIVKRYTFWYHHGERFSEPSVEMDDENDVDECDEMHGILRDLYHEFHDVDSLNHDNQEEEPNGEAKAFYRLLKDSQDPVYEGCKTSKMIALVKLLHIKTLGRWSNESFTMLLQFLKDELLPNGSNLPDSYYGAKTIIKDLGLSYKKIDACVNDCMLYWKEDEELDKCKVCGASRWKIDKRNGEDKYRGNGKKLPQKILRYFPLNLRLQRLYMSSKTASSMRWHYDKRKNDDIMRHPADSPTWKSFDEMYQWFASDPRNVKLGLASDGFQPFANSKTLYSIWPVILIPYNMPPELCMKQSNMILSMLIPGPDSPGDAIDIYLQPLIEELKELWEIGVETFDASTQRHFQLHAALLWTINDFPAYGMLSGWATKGKLACPCCMKETRSTRLSNGGKQCYMGHRRYLPSNHKFRKQKDLFDGTIEHGVPPQPCSIDDILDQVQDLENVCLSKAPHKKRKISHDKRGDNWNKKSIFF